MSDQTSSEVEPETEAENPEEVMQAALDGYDELDPEARITQLESELEVAKDRMMRLAADLENTRKRAAREKTEASQYAIKGFAGDLLSVADNFQRALENAPEDPSAAGPDVLKGLINGIRMTEKELLSVFERNGVTRIFPAGDPFDPNLHQAIAEVPGNGEPKGHVVDVAQPGFTIGDRVLRAAMVTVSTGAGAA
ncbi:nucleotide exchange factor GrpE [Parvularcula sp. IMCC14364]|uniref:nucleotide exchange factor GrpE n=1 Tax=Parvularcula sp. IMCC14364 TaxID=3067902 RepID=UPI002741BCDB|nr:nucleotide exchange factor GrpE [Parvularcula sp. IMCC14364]